MAAMDSRAKIIYEKAVKLAKYDQFDGNKCSKKGVIKRDNISRVEYKHMVDDLLHTVNGLDANQAQRVSAYIQQQYKDAAKDLITKLKDFNHNLEEASINQTAGKDGDTTVLFNDVGSKFEKIAAIFTGDRLQDLYADDAYHRKCEEIELLLEGREAERFSKRDVGQHQELADLIEMLKICVPHRSSSLPNNPGATMPNTARGVGPSWQPMPSARGEPGSSGYMETPRGGGIDPTPKCLTARRAVEDGVRRVDPLQFQMQHPQPGPSSAALPSRETTPAAYQMAHSPGVQQSPYAANPLAPQAVDPFAHPQMDPFAQPSDDPFGAPPQFAETVVMNGTAA